jgi:hypothetical protein
MCNLQLSPQRQPSLLHQVDQRRGDNANQYDPQRSHSNTDP